jgi:hypothetical protein
MSIYIAFADADKLAYKSLPIISNLGYAWQSSVDLLATIQNQAVVDLHIAKLMIGCDISQNMSNLLTKYAINLGKSVLSMDIGALHNATLKLLGLGSGLTPSGDDFLCGFIAAAYCKSNILDKCLVELCQIVLDNLAKTNAISATFLRCTVYGEVGTALYNFAKAICDNKKLEETLKQLCTIGYSSGMDTATGFLYGLKIWHKQS